MPHKAERSTKSRDNNDRRQEFLVLARMLDACFKRPASSENVKCETRRKVKREINPRFPINPGSASIGCSAVRVAPPVLTRRPKPSAVDGDVVEGARKRRRTAAAVWELKTVIQFEGRLPCGRLTNMFY